MALSDNARAGLIGVVGASLAFLIFRGGGASLPSDPLAAVPRSSFIAITVDMAELRRSPLFQAASGKEAKALGMGKLAESCGFDPLTRVERLAIAVPEEGDRGEFGVAAHVQVSREELEKCTRALAAEKGGKAETREVGSFVVLEDPTSKSRIAYGRGGLLVVGRGAWLDAMLAAAEKKAPSLADAPEHTQLRAALTGREGWRAPTFVATAVLPKGMRDRLKKEMAGEEGPGAATMAGVLGVSAVGAAIKTGGEQGKGGNVEATLDLVCDSADACAAVEKLIQKQRFAWGKDLQLRMVGLGPIVDALEAKQDGARLRVTTSAGADALAGALDRALRFRGRQEPSKDAILGGGGAPPMRPLSPLPFGNAVETVHPDGGAR